MAALVISMGVLAYGYGQHSDTSLHSYLGLTSYQTLPSSEQLSRTRASSVILDFFRLRRLKRRLMKSTATSHPFVRSRLLGGIQQHLRRM